MRGGGAHRVLSATSALLCKRARKWQNCTSNSGPPSHLPVSLGSCWNVLLLSAELCSAHTVLVSLTCIFLCLSAPEDRLEKRSELRLWCRQRVLASTLSVAM